MTGQKKFAEAEPLLLAGYEGLEQRESAIPEVSRSRVRDSVQRLVDRYTDWDKSEKAAEWKRKLD